MGPRTTLEIAWEEHAPAGLVAEMIREAEMLGAVCRDEAQTAVGLAADAGEGAGEVRWWNNIFEQYMWDGQD
jgi:ESCRT-II complex subunit VPS36